MSRRKHDRTIDSDPANQPGVEGLPKALEEDGDPAGLHEDAEELARALDRDPRDDDEATVHVHPRRRRAGPDPRAPEELAEDAIQLATQGGGALEDDDDGEGLEQEIDREAIAAGIVPQVVSDASLESSANEIDEIEPDEVPPPAPRRTGGRRPGRV